MKQTDDLYEYVCRQCLCFGNRHVVVHFRLQAHCRITPRHRHETRSKPMEEHLQLQKLWLINQPPYLL